MPDDRWIAYARTESQKALEHWIAGEIMQQTRTDGYIRDAFYVELARVGYYRSIAQTYRIAALMAWLERRIPDFTNKTTVAALVWSVIDLHMPREDCDLFCLSCGSAYTSEDPTEWPCETILAIVRSVGRTFEPDWLEPIGDDMRESALRGHRWEATNV